MSNIVYGKNSFFASLSSNRIELALVLDDKLVKKANIKYQIVDRKTLDKLSNHNNHQGYLAYVKEYKLFEVNDMLKKENGLIVMLDGLTDVHNLGAIIRSCECAGVDGIIYPKHNSVRVNDTVAKVASGALENIKIGEVTNLVNTIKYLKQNGYWIVGTAGGTNKIYWDLDYKMNICLIIGSEGKGMSRLVKEECDHIVSLPLMGKTNSLNASVACGIMLYQILNSRYH